MGALGLFFSGPGQTYSISIFINNYVQGFGWSRSLVSTLYSVATLIAGLCLPIIGRKVDLHGHRKMFVFVPLALSAACLWMSFVSNPIMLGIGFIFLRLMGQGSMTLLSQTLVPQWFIKHRGKSLSLMALGGVIASALIPLLNNWLIINQGVSFAWRTLATMLVVIMIPLALIFIRNKPEDIGEHPDGEKIEEDNDLNNSLKNNREESWTLQEAKTTRAFWLRCLSRKLSHLVKSFFEYYSCRSSFTNSVA